MQPQVKAPWSHAHCADDVAVCAHGRTHYHCQHIGSATTAACTANNSKPAAHRAPHRRNTQNPTLALHTGSQTGATHSATHHCRQWDAAAGDTSGCPLLDGLVDNVLAQCARVVAEAERPRVPQHTVGRVVRQHPAPRHRHTAHNGRDTCMPCEHRVCRRALSTRIFPQTKPPHCPY